VLLAPLALLLSVLAVPIVLMYVLKLRRQEYRVPSTFLWRQVMEDVQANAPWQRLRFNILLLLQLLALGAVILSLAQPAYSRSHVIAGDLVVILDQSYGMQAHDVRPSRFVVAQGRARALASELAGGHVMSVIGMSAQPHLVIADSSDAGAIRDAVGRLRVGVDQPNFLEALTLAASLARANENTRVVVLTSRDSGISSLPLPVSFPVDIVRIGRSVRDLGITDFSVSQRPSGVDAVARVANFGGGTARSDLELFVDGQLSDVRPLAIAPHREQNLFWSSLPAGAQRFHVELTQSDDMSADKSAWAAVPGASPRRVLLVTTGDYFLEAALIDDPSVRLTVVPPAAYRPGMEAAYNAAVFDGFLPPAFPRTSSLLVGPPRGQLGPLRFGKTAAGGAVSAASGLTGSAASILKYVDLGDVHVAQTRATILPGWLQTLATAGGNTVLAAGERNATRIALVDFELQRSDWPLRISFPVVLQNLLPYLAPGLTLGESTIAAGGTVTFFPPPGTQEIRVTRPDGTVDRLSPPFPPFTDTSRAGLYQVSAVKGALKGLPSASGGLSTSFAVNFFPIRPAPAGGPATLHIGHARTGQTLIASVPISVVWVFELVALVVLAGEWWISFRGMRLR
jgi:hypothetical protein